MVSSGSKAVDWRLPVNLGDSPLRMRRQKMPRWTQENLGKGGAGRAARFSRPFCPVSVAAPGRM